MIYESKKYDGDKEIGSCIVTTSGKDTWRISSWFVDKNYQNRGIGRSLLRESLLKAKADNGLPKQIDYTWNMENEYVYTWLEKNFDPVCDLSIADMKYCMEDQKMGHVYHLNTKKVLEYFKLED